MRKTLLALMILVASLAQATKWYASPTGGGSGTISSPYTMAVAMSAAAPGDTIVPVDGTYSNTGRFVIKEGVTIMGSDTANVIFNCSYAGVNFALESASITTSSQLIQGITFNGNMVGTIGFYIVNRHDVNFNKVSIKNFRERGIHGQNPTGGGPPLISGFDITNSRIVNCSHFNPAGSYGNLWLNGHKDFTIKNCYIEASFRAGDSAGFALKLTAVANYIVDSNDIRVIGHNDNLRWAFALESNHNWGGATLTHNNFQGLVDFAGYHTFKGTYDFSMKFLYNTVGHPELTYYLQQGMKIEATGTAGDFSGVEIAYNRFKNVTYGIIFECSYANSVFQNINIHHNVFATLGILGQTYNYGVGVMNSSSSVVSSTLRDLYIDNNVFIASTVEGTRQSAAIELPIKVTAKNIRARNNIMIGFDNAAIMTRFYSILGTLDSVFLQNNISFGNANGNDPLWLGIAPTNLTNTGNIESDPLLNYNYKLTSLSPGIDSGLNIGYIYKGAAPDIGAYEFTLNRVGKASGKVGKYKNKIGRY